MTDDTVSVRWSGFADTEQTHSTGYVTSLAGYSVALGAILLPVLNTYSRFLSKTFSDVMFVFELHVHYV